MKIIHLEQGSKEWLEYRRSRIGASEAPIILGESPWKKKEKLLEEKITAKESYQNAAMKWGRDTEEEARQEFCKLNDITVRPIVGENDALPWQMASFDGMDIDMQIVVEIKCPKSMKSHLEAYEKRVPHHYWIQIQHQLCVSGLKDAFYFSYFMGEGITLPVKRDDMFIDEMIREEEAFYQLMQL